MRILYVCQRVPYPPDRGDKIASYHAVKHLARRHSVCVAAPADSDAEIANADALRRSGIEVLAVAHSPHTAAVNAFLALPRRTPFSVAYFRSTELARQVRQAASASSFDVAIAFSSSMAQYGDLLPNVPLVADFVDLDSQKWALYARFARLPKAWLYAAEERRLLEWERRVAGRAALTLVRTRGELDDCRRLLPRGRFEVLSNGVDLEYFRPSESKTATNEIVFTGVMDYYPNEEGVLFFADEVFPRVRREVPEATFTIVGSRPTRRILRLRTRPGISVTGRVPDVRPYLERAAVAVAPLRLARGVQNKVLEALAMATPVVASSAAAAGIDAQDGDGFRAADEPRAVAALLVDLLRAPADARRLGAQGRALVERRYRWDDHITRLENLLLGVTGARRVASAS
jgi:sugar transferase (PEP-CTERM/EpsH1 system associated)